MGRTKATSPSISALFAGKLCIALAIAGKRTVQSSPLRLIQRDLIARFARQDAVAVIFRFVQPRAPGRHFAVERGELRLYELGCFRAGGVRRGFAVPLFGAAVFRAV